MGEYTLSSSSELEIQPATTVFLWYIIVVMTASLVVLELFEGLLNWIWPKPRSPEYCQPDPAKLGLSCSRRQPLGGQIFRFFFFFVALDGWLALHLVVLQQKCGLHAMNNCILFLEHRSWSWVYLQESNASALGKEGPIFLFFPPSDTHQIASPSLSKEFPPQKINSPCLETESTDQCFNQSIHLARTECAVTECTMLLEIYQSPPPPLLQWTPQRALDPPNANLLKIPGV